MFFVFSGADSVMAGAGRGAVDELKKNKAYRGQPQTFAGRESLWCRFIIYSLLVVEESFFENSGLNLRSKRREGSQLSEGVRRGGSSGGGEQEQEVGRGSKP